MLKINYEKGKQFKYVTNKSRYLELTAWQERLIVCAYFISTTVWRWLFKKDNDWNEWKTMIIKLKCLCVNFVFLLCAYFLAPQPSLGIVSVCLVKGEEGGWLLSGNRQRLGLTCAQSRPHGTQNKTRNRNDVTQWGGTSCAINSCIPGFKSVTSRRVMSHLEQGWPLSKHLLLSLRFLWQQLAGDSSHSIVHTRFSDCFIHAIGTVTSCSRSCLLDEECRTKGEIYVGSSSKKRQGHS